MTCRFVARTFCAWKLGSTAEEFEDAYALSAARRAGSRGGRYAVADGATMASFSHEWARLLVTDFVQHPFPRRGLCDRAELLAPRFTADIAIRALPWYAKQKARLGSFAAVVGLALHRPERHGVTSGRWTAWSVGDACLFQVRENVLITRFPIETSAEFGNHPVLLSTRSEANQAARTTERRERGSWQIGDCFLLMTDALAEWFLRSSEEGERPWDRLDNVTKASEFGDAEFCRWADARRNAGEIRNDDVTLLIVEVDDGDEPASAP